MRKRVKKAKNDRLGYIIIGFVVTVLTAIAIFIVSNQAADTDHESMCRVDGKFDRQIIILDMTDNYNSIQVTQIKHIIMNIIDNLKIDEQIQLFFIDSTLPADVQPLVTLCNPGDGEGKSRLYSNPVLLKKRWEKRFNNPLMKNISPLSDEYSSTKSPIIETIQVVNNIAFPYVKRSDTHYKITIISDMIQNSDALSFFRASPATLEGFVDSKEFFKIRTDLEGVDVDIVEVRRDKFEGLQNREYIDFWINLLENMNANVESIKMTDG
ncbi:MAG: hypothetical protein MUP09_07310 [Thiovulaceae bacterium]|nr:hypothetical protein [Sulfurimonadaceae bacterium]